VHDQEIDIAARILEKLVEQRVRQPIVTPQDIRDDVHIAWRYTSVLFAEVPKAADKKRGF